MTDYKKALEGRTIKEVKDSTSGAFEAALDDGMRMLLWRLSSQYALLKSNELIERGQ